MCEARHPDSSVECRLSGQHPEHFGGYGRQALSWPNPDFVPFVARIPKNKLVELAQRTREFNADTLS
jgi:hypothetical protein